MTDRELLEAAARSIGRDYNDPAHYLNEDGSPWNPKDNTSDAFRLAMRHEMLIDFMDGTVIAGRDMPEVTVDFDPDDKTLASVRFAILYAAAKVSTHGTP
jgi:hypothetical protein